MTQIIHCPKCGSNMEHRKIWKKSIPTPIMQCSVCKFYLHSNSSNNKTQ